MPFNTCKPRSLGLPHQKCMFSHPLPSPPSHCQFFAYLLIKYRPQPTPTVTGWHPTHIQRHFNHMSATNPPLSPSQKEEIKRKAIHAATHGKFLQTCLEDVQKRNAFATQVLEKYTELSQEIEQRKKQLGNQLKRLRR